MLFSFVIPTYNRALKVSRAIDSILNQPEWALTSEIVIVDDGSTDDTETLLQKYILNNQLRLIKHPSNRGVASAKNTGILNAKHEYVVLLDSDDLLEVNGLKYLNKLILNNRYDVVFCGTKVLKNNALMYDPAFWGIKSYTDMLVNPVGEYLPVCKTQLMQKNLLRNLRGYESITWLSMAKVGCKIYYDTEPLVLVDDQGDDRISVRLSGMKNSAQMSEGYALYLKEFGADLKRLNYMLYLKINFKMICYSLMRFYFEKKNQN
ncbi:glycosyltransferase family 2 protein [Arcticibacter eurypsychrophilus]|uniref:glycosyltransferase family 2 protein n=1 Tax=Arcticibacter eurypsychrophilus TaxID=1434752 RepID=UPI00084D3356|nr:glycosyltransferase family 2 protein [Arcticibacter eurypsychrophilus]